VPLRTGDVHGVRLLTWIAGDLISATRRSAAQRSACGQFLGRLQAALHDFRHAASGHAIIWDLQHALHLRDAVFTIPDATARAEVTELLDKFETCVVPELRGLRRQVLHNDAGVNMLVDPADPVRPIGVIDFGDIAETAVVFDVAIAAAAQPGPDMSASAAIGHFIGGFHSVRPLQPQEVSLLPLLVAVRMAMGLVLASWHRHSQPDNPHFGRVQTTIDQRLATMAEICRPEMTQVLRRVCGLS
ncbi:MAG TPA: phosphotransferase, partial [Acetobacteraceae bacterium]|nr:phosphotransferase [Acetobacteraceae bacterium]